MHFLCISCCRILESSSGPRYAAAHVSPWPLWEKISVYLARMLMAGVKSESISSTVEEKTFVSTKAAYWKEVRMKSQRVHVNSGKIFFFFFG